MSMEGVNVIGAKTSLFCARVEWALRLKGVEYKYFEEDILNKSSMLLKYNHVYKKVPVLVHDDKPVSESLVILEYVDEMWTQFPLLPATPFDKSLARFWAKFGDEECLMKCWEAYKSEGQEKDTAIKSAQECLGHLEKLLEEKTYFGGDKLGYLDFVMGWIPLWLSVMEQVGKMRLLDRLKFPFLYNWSQQFNQVSIVNECLPPRDVLINYFTASLEYLRSLALDNS